MSVKEFAAQVRRWAEEVRKVDEAIVWLEENEPLSPAKLSVDVEIYNGQSSGAYHANRFLHMVAMRDWSQTHEAALTEARTSRDYAARECQRYAKLLAGDENA